MTNQPTTSEPVGIFESPAALAGGRAIVNASPDVSVRTVAVLGTGMMGTSVALALRAKGCAHFPAGSRPVRSCGG